MKLMFLYLIIIYSIAIQAQMNEITLDYLKNNSTNIIIAKTKSITTYKINNRTFSDVKIEVLENIKGKLNTGNMLILKYIGGTIDGRTTLVLESPGFSENEESILFLTEHESKTSPRLYPKVLIGSSGKFNIIKNENTKEKILLRDKSTLPLKISLNTTNKLFEDNIPVLLDDFIKLIKQ